MASDFSLSMDRIDQFIPDKTTFKLAGEAVAALGDVGLVRQIGKSLGLTDGLPSLSLEELGGDKVNVREGRSDKLVGDGAGREVNLVSRQSISKNQEELTVHAGGREIKSLVLLPDNYDPSKKYTTIVALHGFTANAKGFAESIDAERMRSQGAIVILPEASRNKIGLREWQGIGGQNITPGIATGDDGKKINDTQAILGTLAIAKKQYGIDPKDLNMLAFSQGVAFAFDVADRLDKQEPGAVKRLFAATGTVPNAENLSLKGTEIVHYEPKRRNYVQKAWNFIQDNPSADEFMSQIEKNKGCRTINTENSDRLSTTNFTCTDGTTLTTHLARRGGHAFPGQPEARDFAIVGRGSRASVKLSVALLEDLVGNRKI